MMTEMNRPHLQSYLKFYYEYLPTIQARQLEEFVCNEIQEEETEYREEN